jgi:hypothetical protein
MKRIVLVCLVTAHAVCFGQSVNIKKIDLAGQKVIITYDLEDSNPGNEYLLNLYTSKDNFSAAMTHVTGDIGQEVKPGTDKRVEWNLVEDLGAYKGRLSFEVRGKMFVPFVKLQNFDAAKSYKRGNTYDIGWKAGSTNAIHIELYKGSQRITGELNHPNNGAFSMTFPGSAKPGKDYRIKITDSKNAEDVVYTGYFKVAPKVPLLLKIIPAIAIVGAVAVLAGGSKSNSPSGGGDSAPTPIADPPGPGG